MKKNSIQVLERALLRERLARQKAEEILESKSYELYQKNAELIKMNEDLDVIVKNRTQDLEIAKNEAIQMSQTKSKFLAIMSHEIRTPLHGIIGLVDLLNKESLNKDQLEYVSMIYQSSELLLSIINEILDFSRIEAGQIHVEKQEFDLKQLVESIAKVLSHEAFKKDLNFVVFVDPRIKKPVVSDPRRLKQIIMNLVGNAIKFTDKGEIGIFVEKLADTVLFTVTDTGVGIPQEKLQSIFDPYKQLKEGEKTFQSGSGLGLSIARELIQKLDGQIHVESHEGHGTSFIFEIPHVEEIHDLSNVLENVELITKSPLTMRMFDKMQSILKFKLCYSDMADEVLGHNVEKVKLNNEWYYLVPPHLKEKLNYENIILKPIQQRDFLAIQRRRREQKSALSDFQAYKVLLVEDNKVNQKIATLMLKKLGINPVVCEDGKMALEAILKEDFDAILMDCQMPVMNGFEATHAIRKLSSEKNDIKVIALTANAFEETQKKCLSTGMNDFLSKPFTIEDLNAVLKRNLS